MNQRKDIFFNAIKSKETFMNCKYLIEMDKILIPLKLRKNLTRRQSFKEKKL